ncbi:methionyl-tRNA formyltransferase [Parasporobacterium paucivorans]|uniref:Methionyl-tRNA formyltransferase n=1 Tax=Parasporobacterium paucivorans DSM 15970 TaxID=1122934 RepID=A0A1M6ESF9_9FIRM|nr:methionyl-tRNA formyltransferase [Parasporobacterium paucivorans]SHI88343.1 methionyl-tRNA formyltransferase [Parasporobacterium paucivorans DSM 15970]
MKIVFMGTPDFSVPSLHELIRAGHEILAVISQPDKPKGRGKNMQFTPVKEAALEYGIPVYQPDKVSNPEFINQLKGWNPDIIVVIAFGQILPREILDIPRFGCINVHASLLPAYRGAAPIQRVIMDGKKTAGVTTMFMSEGLDEGDMIDKIEIPIEDKETYGSLHDKLSLAGARLLLVTLDKLEKGEAARTVQDSSVSNYAKMIHKQTGHIDFTDSAETIERLIRGLNPWPSAYTKLDGKNLKIWDAVVLDDEYPGIPGEIVELTDKSLYVKTGRGTLSITSLQMEGKKKMNTNDFLRGYKVIKGTVLG